MKHKPIITQKDFMMLQIKEIRHSQMTPIEWIKKNAKDFRTKMNNKFKII